MKQIINCLTVLVLLACLRGAAFSVHEAAADCNKPEEAFKRHALASASVLSNAANRKGSLRFESSALLTEALTQLDSSEAAPCPAECPKRSGAVSLKTVPHAFLSDYSDAPLCAEHLAQTSAAPLLYENRSFANLEELNTWVGDFSQGKGTDGKDLYQRCPGDCSPQFEYEITKPTPAAISATARVICGPARDKADNQYDLHVLTSAACR